MKTQACEPCAKRKVRCDKGEPCSNCKRRKQDPCTYPEASPFDRIKRLEALVQSLGGDPESDAHSPGKQTLSNVLPATSGAPLQDNNEETTTQSTEGKSRDPVILEEDGQPFYLESCVSFP